MSLMDAMKEIREMRTAEASLPATVVVAYTTEEGGKWWKVNTESIRNRIHVKINSSPLYKQTFIDWFNVHDVTAIKLANGDIYDFVLGSWRHLYGQQVGQAIKQHKQSVEAGMINPVSAAEQARISALDTQEGGSHYKSIAIQPIEYITKNKIPYPEGNVIKYVTRHATKNGIEDIKKAIHYLQLIAELQYGTKL